MVILDLTTSLDGYVAGSEPSLEDPLGTGGLQLHEWLFAAASWREQHGQEGGERNADSELYAETTAATGAVIMGRRMFSGGNGPWEDDPQPDGWWGEKPPFRVPVFVLTHHRREPLFTATTIFTFVSDGIESALGQARAAAGGLNVGISGGASVAQQFLRAGLVDELQLHVAPVLLGDGLSPFEGVGPLDLDLLRVIDSPRASHLHYAVSARGG